MRNPRPAPARRTPLAAFLLAALLAGGVSAQISPVGPFTGTRSEGFESQTHMNATPCVMEDVFGGFGTLCTPGKSGCYLSHGWSFKCTTQEHGGARFFGSSSGFAEYEFEGPVTRFGGYFATNSGAAGGLVEFFDAAGIQIGSALLTLPADCTWHWNGWEVPVGAGFTRVRVRGNYSSEAFVQMDDMELDDFVPDLAGTPETISLSVGGAQDFQLEAGLPFAGLPYLLLGSISGDSPGFPIDGLTIPLNVDAYTFVTLHSPNAPPLSNSFGTLDPFGSATAALTIPSGLSQSLVGTVFHHAYVVIELTPTLLAIVYISDSVPLTLVP